MQPITFTTPPPHYAIAANCFVVLAGYSDKLTYGQLLETPFIVQGIPCKLYDLVIQTIEATNPWQFYFYAGTTKEAYMANHRKTPTDTIALYLFEKTNPIP
jgi:hypothetical protein